MLDETTKRDGRPPCYSRDQLVRAVDIAEAEGQPATPVRVKDVLVSRLGCSSGLNKQSLSEALALLLAERVEEPDRQAIAALPESARLAVRAHAQGADKAFLVAAARVHGDLRADAGREIEAVRAERRQLAARCEGLTVAAEQDAETMADLRAQVARLEAERDDLRRRFAESEGARQIAEARHAGQDDIVAVLRGLIGQGDRTKANESLANAISEGNLGTGS